MNRGVPEVATPGLLLYVMPSHESHYSRAREGVLVDGEGRSHITSGHRDGGRPRPAPAPAVSYVS
jgi:hypothetical protein